MAGEHRAAEPQEGLGLLEEGMVFCREGLGGSGMQDGVDVWEIVGVGSRAVWFGSARIAFGQQRASVVGG